MGCFRTDSSVPSLEVREKRLCFPMAVYPRQFTQGAFWNCSGHLPTWWGPLRKNLEVWALHHDCGPGFHFNASLQAASNSQNCFSTPEASAQVSCGCDQFSRFGDGGLPCDLSSLMGTRSFDISNMNHHWLLKLHLGNYYYPN